MPRQRMREHVYSRSRVVLIPSLYESWGRVGHRGVRLRAAVHAAR
ncbi:hypothetical protein [Streptomyces erythrochromogenes]